MCLNNDNMFTLASVKNQLSHMTSVWQEPMTPDSSHSRAEF